MLGSPSAYFYWTFNPFQSIISQFQSTSVSFDQSQSMSVSFDSVKDAG